MTAPLHPDHLEDLRRSGLSDDTIARARLYSVRPNDIAKIATDPRITSLLAFPYTDEFTRYKVFPTNLKAKTKTGSFRYLQLSQSGVHIYLPPGVGMVLPNPTIPLGIVEGEKKALKGWQEGLMCLAIGGLYLWLTHGRLTPELKAINWRGRSVPLYPDSDVWKYARHDLRQAVYRLGCALEAEGAHVTVCVLPSGPGQTKQGLDDYLLTHTLDEVQARPHIPLTHKRFDRCRAKAHATESVDLPLAILNGRKQLISCQHNALLWLTAQGFPAKIRLDTFRQEITVDGQPLTDELVIELVRQMEDSEKIHWTDAHVRSAVISLATRNASSGLTTWLDALQWDQKSRLWTFFRQVYGADDSEYSAMCGQILFLSAVARAYQPGCKADVMVVLIGDQGLGKSKGIEDLVPDQAWYTDDLGGDLNDRKAAEGLQGKWILEFSEFARINRATLDVVKAFLSRRVDHYRPAYGHLTKDFPRQCIFIGTTNNPLPLHDWENRRFMPVRCTRYRDEIPELRPQLWAEAVHRYKAGMPWWVTDAGMLHTVKAQQEDARQHDEWEMILQPRLLGVRRTTLEAVADCLGIKPDRLDKSIQIRLGLVIKVLGFTRKRESSGSRAYFWERDDSC
jgi:hypothetical protein